MKDLTFFDDAIDTQIKCYHCGQTCGEILLTDSTPFCCDGCRDVYEMLNHNNLCEYYLWDENPGIPALISTEIFDMLNRIRNGGKILEYDSIEFARVRFLIPSMHCDSCIWLLEHLGKINEAIFNTEVDFSKKVIHIDFNPQKIKLVEIALILAQLGYAPQISFEKCEQRSHDHLVKTMDFNMTVGGAKKNRKQKIKCAY